LVLSLVPPFYIVAPNRELANTLFSFDISISNISLFILIAQNPSNMNMNINTDVTRERSASSNINNSRESSTHLDISSVLWQPLVINVKIVDGGLYFIFPFHFYFTFLFFFLFNFLFLEQLGLGFISHAVTSVTN